jgi:NitT/TauT family transport system ATP-binding protein
MSAGSPLKIGFIPLADAASLFVAVDKGFAAEEGLEIELVQEASWSNIRDRLAIGHYDAAHLLSPMAIASTLGLSHVKVPIVAAFNLAMNGNAITVSRALHTRLLGVAEGDPSDPSVSARALKAIVSERETRGEEPLTFGMTFPFSAHNYQLRFWLAAGGVDPDRDVRLVALPPPYMTDNLAKGHVDGFCVGAPWNAVAIAAGVGVVLHSSRRIFHPCPEKSLAFRADVAARDPGRVEALIRACLKAADFVTTPENLEEAASLLSSPDRVGVDAQTLRATLDGARRDGDLIFGDRVTGCPTRSQAAWIYAQMLRWRQARFSAEHMQSAQAAFDPTHFVRATGAATGATHSPIAAFAGPQFDPSAIGDYLAGFEIGAKS